MAANARLLILAVFITGVVSVSVPAPPEAREQRAPAPAQEPAARRQRSPPGRVVTRVRPRAAPGSPNDWLFKVFGGDGGEAYAGVHSGLPLALVVPLATLNVGRLQRPPPAPRAQPREPLPYFPFVEEDPFESNTPSKKLVELFRAQKPTSAEQPPVVTQAFPTPRPAPTLDAAPAPEAEQGVVVRTVKLPAGAPLPPGAVPVSSTPRTRSLEAFASGSASPAAGSPAVPRFTRSLAFSGSLTLPTAGYTETYAARWHAPTGSMRVDFYDGTTSVFRAVNDSRIHRVERRLDRTGAAPLFRCAVMTQAAAAAPADTAPPALPDMTPFSFAGYVPFEDVPQAERWTHTVSGAAGERGGARGEALVTRHEMLLTRGPDDFITPLRYTVGVDSSVLGADCDGHVHRYRDVRALAPREQRFRLDLARGCDAVEPTADLARVDPLREFTMLSRDPRHDDHYTSFVSNYKRNYSDATEEAVRKNVVMQLNRFAAAGSRVGATFSLGTTSLSDRLQAEMAALTGLRAAAERLPAEPFPYSREQTRALHDHLPDEFDWRKLGGVTPAKHQRGCNTCWAFAVTAAVETAVFKNTGRLFNLSEQAIVDCAGPFGGNGCGASWPSAAYDYAQERGLPEQQPYPYVSRAEQCRDRSLAPVAHIAGHGNVTRNSLAAIKLAIKEHAPTVVIVDIMPRSWQTYTGQVYYDGSCNRKPRLLHAVAAVGWGAGGTPSEHLILKNSWGAGWGDNGFMLIEANPNTCGVLERPSYPLQPSSTTIN